MEDMVKRIAGLIEASWASSAFNTLFKELVPRSGKADTVEGEILRATGKIIYRWYNDGDVPTGGYGVETSGPALAFLLAQDSKVRAKARAVEKAGKAYWSDGGPDSKLEAALTALERVVAESAKKAMEAGELRDNSVDMFSYRSKASSMWDENESRWDYDEEDDW
jgi:hypothetical protein